MLSYLAGLEEYFGPLRLFGSITLRTMLAAVTAMLLGFLFGPRLIRHFRRLKLGHGYVDERTVHLGASPVPCAPEGAPHPDLIGQRFILALGTVERRKNLPRLVAAFGHCAAHAPHLLLVIAGAPGDDSDAVDRAIDRLGPARSRVLRTGAVDAATRAWLLRHAAVIAYPSLDEGFGFPVLDAFSVGVPLVASTAGSIPEVAGDAALLVPPLDVDALAAAISRAIDDDDLRARLVGLGNDRRHAFSWETCAEQMVDLYHRVARGDRELGGEDGPGCADAPTSTT